MATEQIFLMNSDNSHPSPTTQKPFEMSEEPIQMDIESIHDFSNVCRTCAAVSEFVIPIFEGEGLQNNLADKISKHLPIQVSETDMLPRVVCYQCASTLLAWHELVSCCVQADAALRTRMPVPYADQATTTKQENCQNSNKIPEEKWKACTNNLVEGKDDASGLGDDARSVDDEDEPLATIANRKTNDLYNNFYKAFVNFTDHFSSRHKSSYPDFTDSSDVEESENSYVEDKTNETNIENYDDLTHNNMRKDRMDTETRLELVQVQKKINGKVFYTCKICDKNLSSPHTYFFHKRIHTGERPCVCHICGKQFRAPNGLQRHLTETHERIRRHTCLRCHKSFANSQNLKQHIRIHTGERPYACVLCEKRFTQSGSLHVHLKTHIEQYPHHCAECGAKFRLRSGLARHKLKHTGERPHVCLYCGKGFRQRHELNSHVTLHTDAKPHACSLCGLAFKQRRALRYHAKRVHEADARPTTQLVYEQVTHY
ncbi:zinc finger protein 16 isoform X3 [Manduca sexta]|uniref:zinc finger protein 16 isoform X3 n=1 Tax=Manduca sexta TaxID=7130 RepID=UPI0011828D99|nr:zinc finger protein 16 isoform X3 [Manduca sexta]